MTSTGFDCVAVLLLGLALPACDQPAQPTAEHVTDLSGVWQASDPQLGGFSQTVIWTITQQGDAFAGSWNNGTVPAGTAVSGDVTGRFDRASSRVTFSMTWMPQSPNPLSVCAWAYQDPLVTIGSGTVMNTGVQVVLIASYGDWTGCRGGVESRSPGQIVLIRR
jgi:hypothetical protein